MKHETSLPQYVLIISMAASFTAMLLIPPITDEFYYLDWASRSGWPAMGFFDHPPFVSWLGIFFREWRNIWAARSLVWLTSVLNLFFVWRTARLIGPSREWTVVAILASTIGGLASGVFLTPDTGLILMWNIALHEASYAIVGQKKRWITAGIATGFGLLSKYTMVLIGPVFLWGLLRGAPRQLRTPWPYLGGIVALLIFAPHLWWQQHNNWITAKFQFGHGFSVRQELDVGSTLPLATAADKDSNATKLRIELLDAISKVPGAGEFAFVPKPQKSKIERASQYVGDFIGGTLALWGAYFILWIVSVLQSKSRRTANSHPLPKNILRPVDHLMIGAFAFPLLFFGIISPFTKIEANWPAMHMAPLAIFATTRIYFDNKSILRISLIHVFLILAIAFLSFRGDLLPYSRGNRILQENFGYNSFSTWIENHSETENIAVDSYQLKAALKYYKPETNVVQWPGITRPSEYTRGFIDDVTQEKVFLASSQFTLISASPRPVEIKGFSPTSYAGLRVCPDGSIVEFSTRSPYLPCPKGIREWWVTEYRAR